MVNLILNSWIHSISKSPRSYNALLRKEQLNELKIDILALLKSRKNLRVAYIDDKESIQEVKDVTLNNICLSFIVYEGDLLYYGFTKKAFRKKGYFYKLLKHAKLLEGDALKCIRVTDGLFHFCKHKKIKINYLPICPI